MTPASLFSCLFKWQGLISFTCMLLVPVILRAEARLIVAIPSHGMGLKTWDGKPSGFWEIAGPDGKYMRATTEIAGDKVIVTAPGVSSLVGLRLGGTC